MLFIVHYSILKNNIYFIYPHIVECLLWKGGISLKIIVHYPQTPEKQAEFDARVAKFHAEYVVQYIEKLNCPTDQKLKLLDAVAKTIFEVAEEKGKNNI